MKDGPSSGYVTTGSLAVITAKEYNALRDDILDEAVGHDHSPGHGAPLTAQSLYPMAPELVDLLANEETFAIGVNFGDAIAAVTLVQWTGVWIPYVPKCRIIGWATTSPSASDACNFQIYKRSLSEIGYWSPKAINLGGTAPSLPSSGYGAYSFDVSGWLTDVEEGSSLGFYVVSSSTARTQAGVALICRRRSI